MTSRGHSQHRATRHDAGFTLAEALIAVAVLGMIGMLVFGTFARAMDSRERAEALTSHYHQMRQALQRMAAEISMAFLSMHRDCEEKRTQTVFVAKSAHGGMRLDFASFSHLKTRADANESDQNELSYFIDKDPDDPQGSVLMRREQARIDDEPEEGGVTQVLARNVTGLAFEFYDPKEDRWEDEWDSTNMDQRNRLPMFVKIELTVRDHRGEEEKLVTKTRVMLKQALLITGTMQRTCQD